MNLIEQISGGDPLKYDAVFLLPNWAIHFKRMYMADNKHFNRDFANTVRNNNDE